MRKSLPRVVGFLIQAGSVGYGWAMTGVIHHPGARVLYQFRRRLIL